MKMSDDEVKADYRITILNEDPAKIKNFLTSILRKKFVRWKMEVIIDGEVITLEDYPELSMYG